MRPIAASSSYKPQATFSSAEVLYSDLANIPFVSSSNNNNGNNNNNNSSSSSSSSGARLDLSLLSTVNKASIQEQNGDCWSDEDEEDRKIGHVTKRGRTHYKESTKRIDPAAKFRIDFSNSLFGSNEDTPIASSVEDIAPTSSSSLIGGDTVHLSELPNSEELSVKVMNSSNSSIAEKKKVGQLRYQGILKKLKLLK